MLKGILGTIYKTSLFWKPNGGWGDGRRDEFGPMLALKHQTHSVLNSFCIKKKLVCCGEGHNMSLV